MSSPTAQTFHVRGEHVGQTLAAAVRQWMESISWGAAHRLIRTRRVMVNGNVCVDAGRRLKETEVVRVSEQSAPAPPREDDVLIRYIDPHVVVVEKPSGVTSVRHAEEQGWSARRRQIQPTLEEILPRIIAKRERHSPRGRNAPSVRPVHRLDRETSGLMVFARTVKAERHLGLQFREHTTARRYLAVVVGDVAAQTIETQLVRDRGDGRRGSTQEPGIGKRAVTHVEPLEQFAGYTLVECKLETGRTHQIRIHLSERGHPVCGDKVYAAPKFKKQPADTSGAPRLALHARELEFTHPATGERMQFEMPLPLDLQAMIERLRGGPGTKKARQSKSS